MHDLRPLPAPQPLARWLRACLRTLALRQAYSHLVLGRVPDEPGN